MEGLTEKQRRFVEAFVGEAQGNATKAARIAGYKGSDVALGVQGNACLRNPKVSSAIEAARAPRTKAAILTKEQRQSLLSKFANDEDLEPRDRIKAIEVLGKMQGDFIEKREVAITGAEVTLYVPDNGRARG